MIRLWLACSSPDVNGLDAWLDAQLPGITLGASLGKDVEAALGPPTERHSNAPGTSIRSYQSGGAFPGGAPAVRYVATRDTDDVVFEFSLEPTTETLAPASALAGWGPPTGHVDDLDVWCGTRARADVVVAAAVLPDQEIGAIAVEHRAFVPAGSVLLQVCAK